MKHSLFIKSLCATGILLPQISCTGEKKFKLTRKNQTSFSSWPMTWATATYLATATSMYRLLT